MHTLETSHFHYVGNEDGVKLELDFQIEQCGHLVHTEAYDHTQPTPPFNRLFYFSNGGGCDIVFRGQSQHLGPDRFWLIPLFHTLQIHYHGQGDFFFLNFTAKAVSGMDLFRRLPNIVEIQTNAPLRRRFMTSFAGRSARDALRLSAASTEVLVECVHRPEVMTLWREDNLQTRFLPVLNHIRLHNRHGLRVAELADIAGLTPDALRMGFRRGMGMSIKAYLLGDLMHKAVNLVIGTDLSISEIADQLGYDSPYYFERLFKHRLRVPPLRYRRTSHDWIMAHRPAET